MCNCGKNRVKSKSTNKSTAPPSQKNNFQLPLNTPAKLAPPKVNVKVVPPVVKVTPPQEAMTNKVVPRVAVSTPVKDEVPQPIKVFKVDTPPQVKRKYPNMYMRMLDQNSMLDKFLKR